MISAVDGAVKRKKTTTEVRIFSKIIILVYRCGLTAKEGGSPEKVKP